MGFTPKDEIMRADEVVNTSRATMPGLVTDLYFTDLVDMAGTLNLLDLQLGGLDNVT